MHRLHSQQPKDVVHAPAMLVYTYSLALTQDVSVHVGGRRSQRQLLHGVHSGVYCTVASMLCYLPYQQRS